MRRWVLAMVQLSGTGDEMESAQIPIGGSSRVRARLPTHEILAMGDQHPSTTPTLLSLSLSRAHDRTCLIDRITAPPALPRRGCSLRSDTTPALQDRHVRDSDQLKLSF